MREIGFQHVFLSKFFKLMWTNVCAFETKFVEFYSEQNYGNGKKQTLF